MNLLGTLLAIGLFILMMIGAVEFHQATICRQKAWLSSTELITHNLLSPNKEEDIMWLPKCQILVKRKNQIVTWKGHSFELDLPGSI